ncbi:hypothetical protein GGQ60_001243 [Pedobacter zeae]|uniref:Lipoprotein n=1 Tax=Pedobacter zeae TaxID=1737356 RepID=A0A7W6K8R5_9SPHI|nr:hypothetical protein [Pedobacter zeae]
MIKSIYHKIQLLLVAIGISLGGCYYHYYKKNREIDAYKLQLFAKLKSHSITTEEYYRNWELQVVEWKKTFEKCELLELSTVAVFLLSGANLILYLRNKKRISI